MWTRRQLTSAEEHLVDEDIIPFLDRFEVRFDWIPILSTIRGSPQLCGRPRKKPWSRDLLLAGTIHGTTVDIATVWRNDPPHAVREGRRGIRPRSSNLWPLSGAKSKGRFLLSKSSAFPWCW